MEVFAVIDTETNWADQVMSIGVVIADADTFRALETRYYILTPEVEIGGMYENTLFIPTPVPPRTCTRKQALAELAALFAREGVASLFAYNACFDRNHLPELGRLRWFDIMRMAAYRQHNPAIPSSADCCATGRLRRGYGVEPMLRLLSGNTGYQESHNACFDALDELALMRLLARHPSAYGFTEIGGCQRI